MPSYPGIAHVPTESNSASRSRVARATAAISATCALVRPKSKKGQLTLTDRSGVGETGASVYWPGSMLATMDCTHMRRLFSEHRNALGEPMTSTHSGLGTGGRLDL